MDGPAVTGKGATVR